MKGFCARIVVICFVATIAMSSPAAAAWQQNGNNLTPWCAYAPKTCSDAAGGAIVVFQDFDHGYSSPYALRVDGNGNQLWGGVCVPLSWPNTEAAGMCIIPDGAGGAVVAWQDTRNVGFDVYAQRVSASGAVLWNPSGVPVCTAVAEQTQIAMVSDDRGGAVIVWTDERNGNKDIYCTRIDAAGERSWGGPDGIQVTNDTMNQSYPAVVRDGAGGAIIAWQDERSGGFSDIYATKISDFGWTWGGMNGIPVCTAASYQQIPVIASDDAGGAVIFWYDTRSSGAVYGQRMSSIGNAKWAADGIVIGAVGGASYPQSAVSDGAGSVYVGWISMNYTTWVYSAYAQKVSRAGVVEWQAPGFAFSSGEGEQTGLRLLSLGTSGVIAAWNENRTGMMDIFAQKVSPAGEATWTEDGVVLSDAFGNQLWPIIVTDGTGGAIVAWNDDPVATCWKWRVQRVTAEGFWGYPAPKIAGVRDIPGDQGGSVNLAWDASRLDPAPEHLIDHYTVWRAISPTAAAPLLANGARLIADASELRAERAGIAAAAEGASGAGLPADVRPGLEDRVLRAAVLNGEAYYWDLVLTTGAYYLPTYSKAVPTLFDSTETSAERQYFQVIAHTDDPFVFFVSAPDSGRSVDNLAPAAPVGLAGEQQYTPAGLELTWSPNGEGDLGGYAIYRGTSAGFVPGPGNLVASTPDTLYLDGSWSWDGGYFYKVAAVDIHGNVSGYALLSPETITDTDTPKAPAASFLAQNFPNPFNPTTKIAFGLAAPANVSLRIYDASGRLVRTLVEDARPAGNYSELWDGRDSGGRAVASGIYFYRLNAGAYTQTRKMALLR